MLAKVPCQILIFACSFLNWETLKFLHEVAHDPNAGTDKQELWPKIGRYTYSAFAQQTFGLEIKDTSSPSIPYIHGESSTVVWPRDFANRRAETGLAEIIATFPGVYLVDMIQTLDKLPSFMKVWERAAHGRFRRDMNWCRQQMKVRGPRSVLQ